MHIKFRFYLKNANYEGQGQKYKNEMHELMKIAFGVTQSKAHELLTRAVKTGGTAKVYERGFVLQVTDAQFGRFMALRDVMGLTSEIGWPGNNEYIECLEVEGHKNFYDLTQHDHIP